MLRFTRPPSWLIAALLIPYLFLQVQVAVACMLQITPMVPMAPLAANAIQNAHATPGDTCATRVASDQDNCCKVGFQTAADLNKVGPLEHKYTTDKIDSPPVFKIIRTHTDDLFPVSNSLISSARSAYGPAHSGTLTYLKTHRLRI